MPSTSTLCIIVGSFLLLLSGCGQKGALYRPTSTVTTKPCSTCVIAPIPAQPDETTDDENTQE